MLIDRPNQKALTDEDLESLSKLKALIDNVIADGKVSKDDIEMINCAIYSNGKVLIEEVTLLRQMVRDKIDCGLLIYEY